MPAAWPDHGWGLPSAAEAEQGQMLRGEGDRCDPGARRWRMSPARPSCAGISCRLPATATWTRSPTARSARKMSPEGPARVLVEFDLPDLLAAAFAAETGKQKRLI